MIKGMCKGVFLTKGECVSSTIDLELTSSRDGGTSEFELFRESFVLAANFCDDRAIFSDLIHFLTHL